MSGGRLNTKIDEAMATVEEQYDYHQKRGKTDPQLSIISMMRVLQLQPGPENIRRKIVPDKSTFQCRLHGIRQIMQRCKYRRKTRGLRNYALEKYFVRERIKRMQR